MLKPGMYLQNRYEIIEKIGSGGMADVYKAKCHTLNRMVAVKMLKEEFSRDENFVVRFKMEAQATAGLAHPNIVNVYDVVDEGDIHYIIMELIEGITLKNYIAKKGRLEGKETIGIAIQMAQGIAAAHQQNLIHQDIKPQNIIISKDGKVKVTDFGIARAISSRTQDKHTIGSIHYISPEQARGDLVDVRSDIYSLGITMFEMVTGRLPFDGKNVVAVASAHLKNPITPPKECNPDIPESLEQIILKCTEKQPEDRYSTVDEVIVDLRRALINPYDEGGDIPEEPKWSEDEQKTEKKESEEKESEDPVFQWEEKEDYPKKPKKQQDISQQLERIFAAAGVVAAVMIIGVLVFLILHLGGLLNSGSTLRPSVSEEEETSPSAVPELTTAALAEGQVYMPDVMGFPQEEGRKLLEGCGLKMEVSSMETSDKYAIGCIMAQEYPEGTILEKNTVVNVKVSKGTGTIDLSLLGLKGMQQQAAKNLLEERNLVVAVTEENDTVIPAGNVIRYEPEQLREGETVTLFVSKGPALISVPDITGMLPQDAERTIASAGFSPEFAGEEYSDSIEAGKVFNQTEPAGSMLLPGAVVRYFVSLGPKEILIGKTKYIASIDEQYNVGLNIGPGSSSINIEIVIRLRQEVDGKVVYQNLTEPKTVSGDTTVPISFPRIEGADGVENGVVELVDVAQDKVLVSYPVSFFKTEE